MTIKIAPEVLVRFEPLKADLQALYREIGNALPADAFPLEIERRFGERILQEVCIPLGLNLGACLIAAVAIAKGETNGASSAARGMP